MRRVSSLVALILVAPATLTAQTPDSAAFVTRLGTDTLVVERFVRTPRRVEAEVLIRVPRTETTRYVLELDARAHPGAVGISGRRGQKRRRAVDLGRVPLAAHPLDPPVEVFTISVTQEPGNRGALRLQWDHTQLVATFGVLEGS